MTIPSTVWVAAATITGTAVVAWMIQMVLAMRRTTLPNLAGPPSASLFWGNEWELYSEDKHGQTFLEWNRRYGRAYRIKLAQGRDCLMLHDPRALAYVFTQKADSYIHPPQSKRIMERIVGRGVSAVDGAEHKKARRALQPAFNPLAIQSYVQTFQRSAVKAGKMFEIAIDKGKGGEGLVDVQDWAFRIGLDNIGLAGFSFDFNALSGVDSEAVKSLRKMSGGGSTFPMFAFQTLCRPFPFVLDIPIGPVQTMKKLKRMLEMRGRALLYAARQDQEYLPGQPSVLKQLVQSELSEREDQRLTEEEIVPQAATLLFAGAETVSSSLTWALYTLARYPAVQSRIREELASLPEEPSFQQLSATNLPYLDAFIRENLRLNHVLAEANRIALEDDEIPLSQPIKGLNGEYMSSIHVKRGTYITVSNVTMNRSDQMWGPAALEFRPERWMGKLPAAVEEVKAVYGHLYTFGAGPKSCIGYAFAIAEMKVTLAYLVRHFLFNPGPKNNSEEAQYGPFHRLRSMEDKTLKTFLAVRRTLTAEELYNPTAEDVLKDERFQ